ncbi:MAG: radical SAM protein [Bacteroidales bacterium]|nr:radical SAM protein [Bacteroidales bacterium]
MPIDKNIECFKKLRDENLHLCNAPYVSMSIAINGLVAPCCYIHSQPAFLSESPDKFPLKSIEAIWQGEHFSEFRSILKDYKFPEACSVCRSAINNGNFTNIKILEYDNFEINKKTPQVIELTTDNICNLSCVMCSSVYSTKIAEKKGFALDHGVVTRDYLTELLPFFSDLKLLVISGGEPFASPQSLMLMEKLAEINPSCRIAVNTNATILNDRVKRLVEKGNFSFNVSVDSFNAVIYEKIRIGAMYNKMLENINYFKNYAASKSENLVVHLCPLTLNALDIPNTVRYCSQNDFYIRFVHVFNASKFALSSASSEFLKSVIDYYSKIVLAENTYVATQNKTAFENFIAELNENYKFARKKEAFLTEFVHDIELKHSFMQSLDIKMRGFVKQEFGELFEERYDSWKKKIDEVEKLLPNFFWQSQVFDFVLSIESSVLYDTIISYPADETSEFMLSIADNYLRSVL